MSGNGALGGNGPQAISDLSPKEKRELLAQLLRKKAGEPNRFPLSFGQQRLWFLDQLDPGNPVHNMSLEVHFKGVPNVAALEQTINEIVSRHEVLRATFTVVEGQPSQVIAPVLTVPVSVADLRKCPEARRWAEVQRLATEEACRSFDLARGPLGRFTLLQLGEEEYVFLATIHHIVSDAWSWGVFIRELAALYEAFSTGKPSPLPELPIQYADFAVWQRQWLQGPVLEAQLSYWKRQLADLHVLELPIDRPRPPVQTFRGARQFLALPKTLTEALKALSRRDGVTLFMTLLAAFKVLLYRYTGQEDIVVGTPIANRNRVETEGLIGFLVNNLVLRTDLADSQTFRELLWRVHKVCLGAYAHQDVPFEKLVEELRPARDLSHRPLFQVVFVLQNARMPALDLEIGGQTLRSLEVDSGTAEFELTLNLGERPEGLRGWFNYNTDLFDAATIIRMVGHFQTLLEGIVADPERRISALPLLTEAERQLVLREWNDTQRDYPRDQCLHQLFEAQVDQIPDTIAVVFEGEQLTYRELNRRANQMAHHLRALGVGPDVLVGICLERSLEMVVGLLGILKAGGAYVPLDPAYPKERLAFMLQDARVPVLLTQERLVNRLSEHQAAVVCLDSAGEILGQESEANPVSETKAENLAYVIYTSGSTGKPKGVMISHRGICNRLLWMQEAYQLTQADRILQKTPFSFDVSVWEFFWPLLNGARLVVARPEGHQDSAYLVKLIAGQKITTLHFVPSMLQVFLEEQVLDTCNCLKRVFCSGEALPFELQERFFDRLGAELHNLYGPTEASIDVTFWACERESNRQTVPIGRPIANSQIYLLDRHLNPVPVGVPGELYIGGAGLAQGYLNRPELTTERFIPSPFSDESGARLYKTGDLTRYLPDGNIEFLGRIDHQVKIRGYRIELGEIEAVLGQHPAVREAAVMAREDVPGDKRLVAYVIANQQSAPSISELRSFLKEKLPDYMVPSAFVLLDALPLTPSGKVDRRALPAPEGGRPELEEEFVAPRTPVEEVLAGIWKQVLGVNQVGIYDDFFELGGHSLLAAQVISQVRDIFQVELPLRSLFESPVIAGLSEEIEEARNSGTELQVPAIVPVSREASRVKRSSLLTKDTGGF